jgi:hypothetical protein
VRVANGLSIAGSTRRPRRTRRRRRASGSGILLGKSVRHHPPHHVMGRGMRPYSGAGRSAICRQFCGSGSSPAGQVAFVSASQNAANAGHSPAPQARSARGDPAADESGACARRGGQRASLLRKSLPSLSSPRRRSSTSRRGSRRVRELGTEFERRAQAWARAYVEKHSPDLKVARTETDPRASRAPQLKLE